MSLIFWATRSLKIRDPKNKGLTCRDAPPLSKRDMFVKAGSAILMTKWVNHRATAPLDSLKRSIYEALSVHTTV